MFEMGSYVSPFSPCKHGCRDKRGEPVFAELENKVYHFKNTKEPYLLRHCPKCKGSSLIVFE